MYVFADNDQNMFTPPKVINYYEPEPVKEEVKPVPVKVVEEPPVEVKPVIIKKEEVLPPKPVEVIP